jgi:polar amino acid transport system permease protein
VSFAQLFLGVLGGLQVTATVTTYGLMFAVPFALVFGVAQHLTAGVTRIVVTAIIEVWRSSAVIILLFVFYYALPDFGIRLSATAVSSLVLGLNTGAYGSQAIRAGLQSLDKGQLEAAFALGLRRWHSLLLVELPQALRIMAPTFVNEVIQLIKGTALVSLVTLSDMTFQAKQLAEIEYNPVGVYTALLLAYFVVCYPIAIFGRWLERHTGGARSLSSEL